MDNKVLFRTAFQGFRKEDVVAYIDKMSKDTKSMLAEKDSEIKELNSSFAAKESEISELKERCAALEAQLEESRREVTDKDGKIASLSEKLDAKQSEILELMQKKEMPEDAVTAEVFNALEREYSNAVSKIDALQKQLEVYKEFDGVQKDLGTIIIKAEKNASEIIARARSEAQKLLEDANSEARAVTEKKVRVCKEITDSFERSKNDIEAYHRNVCERLDSIRNSVYSFYEALQDGDTKIHETLGKITSATADFGTIADKNQ